MEAMRQKLPYYIKRTENIQYIEMISSEKKKKTEIRNGKIVTDQST